MKIFSFMSKQLFILAAVALFGASMTTVIRVQNREQGRCIQKYAHDLNASSRYSSWVAAMSEEPEWKRPEAESARLRCCP